MDRRVKHTKENLKNTFIDLLNEKPLSRVTVTDICNKGDINRSTYYSYYSDPYKQFEELRNEQSNDIEKLISECNADNVHDIIKSICTYMKEHRKMTLAIYNNISIPEIINPYSKDSGKTFSKIWNLNTDSNQYQYTLVHSMAGTISFLYKWLAEDYDKISVEEITDILTKIDTRGLF